MRLQRTVVTAKPLATVFGYLSGFTTTTDWDDDRVPAVQGGDEVGVRGRGTAGAGHGSGRPSRMTGLETAGLSGRDIGGGR